MFVVPLVLSTDSFAMSLVQGWTLYESRDLYQIPVIQESAYFY